MEKRPLTINHKNFSNDKLYSDHVKNFNYLQKKYFSKFNNKIIKKSIISTIDRKKTNNKSFNNKIKKIIINYKPNLIFTYGCQILDIKILNKDTKAFNIHGGLLPYYRGVNTNFWPHYKNESNKIGITLHKIEKKVDSGKVYLTVKPKIKKNSTINSLSCEAIKQFGLIAPKKTYKVFKKGKNLIPKIVKKKYKSWKQKDFEPSVIPIAYKNFDYYKKKYFR